MGEIVNPGSLSYAVETAITPADGVNNLRMDGVSYRYLHNRGASAVAIKIRTFSGPVTFNLNSGDSWQLPHNAQGVEATGTAGGATLVASL